MKRRVWTATKVYRGDFGNDFTAFFDPHPVAKVQVELGNLVGVVHGGALNLGSANPYWIEDGHWRDRPGAAHLVDHFAQRSAGLLGVEFVGHGPARSLSRHSHALLLFDAVDFNHDSVGGHGEVLAFGIPVGQIVLEFGGGPAEGRPTLGTRSHWKTPSSQSVHGFGVGRKGLLVAVGSVGEHAQTALGNFGGILHFQGSGRCIARVGKLVLTLRASSRVQGFKVAVEEYNFATHLKIARCTRRENQGDSLNRADIRNDIIPLNAVATG